MTIPSSSTIDPKALLAGDNELATRLLATCYPLTKTDKGRQSVARADLLRLLTQLGAGGESLSERVQGKLEPAETLPPFERGVLAFVDLLFKQLLAQTQLHPEAQTLLDGLRPVAAAAALQAESWLGITDHPLRGILAQLCDQLIGWEPDLGRAASAAHSQLRALLDTLPPDGKWAGCTETLAQMQLRASREQQRLVKLEQRLCDTEQGQLRARRAQQLAAKTLNQKMGGKQLSQCLVEFLTIDWFQSMQLTLLHDGEHSSAWQRIKKLTETLIWTVQPYDGDAQIQQQLYKIIPQLADDIRSVLVNLAHDNNRLNTLMAALEAEHLNVLKGATLAYVPFQLIANNDPLMSATTNISRSLLDKVSALLPGQWFLYTDGDHVRRIKLVFKLEEAMQLLFVNQLGLKALQQSFEEFAYLLSSGAAQALPSGAVVTQLIRHLLQEHLNHYQQKRSAQAEASAQAQTTALETKRRADAQAKAATEAKHAAAAEAARRAQAAAQTASIAATGAAAAADPAREQETRALVAGIKVGAWIEFNDSAGNGEKLKLAVVLPTSDKYLFVDRNGMRKAEYKQEELVQRFIHQSARLLKQAAQFEDTLAQVVGNLRRGRESTPGQ